MQKGRKEPEDLEGLLGRLKLTEEERGTVKGAWQSDFEEADRPPRAVGKLFSTKAGYIDGMVQTLGKIWCPEKGIKCKGLEDNRFLFTFLQPGGKRRAITEGPWEFGGDLLIVMELDETKRVKDLEFSHIPVWIRVFDLPMGLMNGRTGRLIGDKVGSFLDVDTDEDGLAVGNYLRIKVMIDVRKPLFRGVMMEAGQGEQPFWCNFKYEFLPNFCYSCGLLGHVEKECDKKIWRDVDPQFGDWLRATPAKKRDLRGRGSGGSSSGGNLNKKNTSGLWRRVETGRSIQQGEVDNKGKSLEDRELRDDGSSPLKLRTSSTNAVSAQKRLAFGECASTDQESGAELVVQEGVKSGVPIEGKDVQGLDSGEVCAKTAMDVDVVENIILGEGLGIGENNEKIEEVKGEENDATKKRPTTFKRRPRVPKGSVGEQSHSPVDSRKRGAEDCTGEVEFLKKSKVLKESVAEGMVEYFSEKAGLHGQPCRSK